MREKRTIQASIFEGYAEHEIDRAGIEGDVRLAGHPTWPARLGGG